MRMPRVVVQVFDTEELCLPELRWTFGPVSEQTLPGPVRGPRFMYILKDTQKAPISVVGDDKKGFATSLPSGSVVVISSSDSSVVSVVDNGDGTGEAVAGNPGTAQVQVAVNAADGSLLQSGTADVQVVAGDLATIAVSLGGAEDQ